MKKTLVYGVATAAVLAALGAGFGMTQCTQQELYGPPPADESSASAEANDPIETVYGPPPEMDSQESASDDEGSEAEDIPTALYGPPPK